MERRSFLKSSAAATTALAIPGGYISEIFAQTVTLAPGPGNKWPGRVAINFNRNAVTNTAPNDSTVKTMVDDSVKLLTGASTVGAAWKAVFPTSLTAQSKIAIKVNILNDGITCSNPVAVQAICEGLQQMDFGGTKFPAGNITIYDMNNGKSLSTAGFTTTRFPSPIKLVKDSTQVYGDGACGNKSYATSLKAADFLINVPSLRGHGATWGNVTLGFKSHLGTYRWNVTDTNASPIHTNGAQNIRDMTCTGPVYNKLVLTVCTALYGQYIGVGPQGSAQDYSRYVASVDSGATTINPSTILMSTDPVSLEVQALRIMRIQQATSYTTDSMPTYLKASGGISGALTGTTYNIGIIDESRMDIRRILNGTTLSVGTGKTVRSSDRQSLSAVHLPGSNSTFIEYAVPQSMVGMDASIEIYDMKGSVVRSYRHKADGAVNQLSWDERDGSGNRVRAGSYVVRLSAGSVRRSVQLTVSR